MTLPSELLLPLCPGGQEPVGASVQQFFRREAKSMDNRSHPGPLVCEKLLALALQQQLSRALFHEHAETPAALDEILVHQFLISLEDRERIHSIIGGYRAHRWQWVPLLEHFLKD